MNVMLSSILKRLSRIDSFVNQKQNGDIVSSVGANQCQSIKDGVVCSVLKLREQL